jgi:hypothetical protein
MAFLATKVVGEIITIKRFLPLLAKADWLDYNPRRSGRGSARLERTVRVREVPSSNLGAPTKILFPIRSP